MSVWKCFPHRRTSRLKRVVLKTHQISYAFNTFLSDCDTYIQKQMKAKYTYKSHMLQFIAAHSGALWAVEVGRNKWWLSDFIFLAVSTIFVLKPCWTRIIYSCMHCYNSKHDLYDFISFWGTRDNWGWIAQPISADPK